MEVKRRTGRRRKQPLDDF